MKLILQAHRETVKWADGLLVLGEICIESFGVFDGGVEEDFMETVYLCRRRVSLVTAYCLHAARNLRQMEFVRTS